MKVEDYETFLKHVYRTAPIGLCLFDTELRYRHINEWLASINGLSVDKPFMAIVYGHSHYCFGAGTMAEGNDAMVIGPIVASGERGVLSITTMS